MGLSNELIKQKLTEKFGEMAERIHLGAIQAGLTVEAYQKLGNAAAKSGVSQEEMGMSLSRLERKLYNAKIGNKEASEAFQKLGFSSAQRIFSFIENILNFISSFLIDKLNNYKILSNEKDTLNKKNSQLSEDNVTLSKLVLDLKSTIEKLKLENGTYIKLTKTSNEAKNIK